MKKFVTFLMIGLLVVSGVPAAMACNGVAQVNAGYNHGVAQQLVSYAVVQQIVPVQGVLYQTPTQKEQQNQVVVEQPVQQEVAYVATQQGCAQRLLANLNSGYAVQQVILPHQNLYTQNVRVVQHHAQRIVVQQQRGQRVRLFNGNLGKRVRQVFQNLRNNRQNARANRIVRVNQIQQVRVHNRQQLNFRADRKVTGQLFIQNNY